MGGNVTGTRHHLLQEGARTITVGRGRPAAAAHPELAPVLLDGRRARLLRCGDEAQPSRLWSNQVGSRRLRYLTSTVPD